jgi:hypothetical protein
MGDLFGALITLFVFLLIAPIVILAIVVSLGLAAIGVAISIFFALLGLALHILFAASPFIVIFGLLYLIFRPSPKRELVRH